MIEFEFLDEVERKTVGVLISGIMDEFNEQLCKGITKEAEKNNMNVVIIPVKYINREMKDIPDIYEYQYQTNISNITAANINLLIVPADTIGCLTNEENLKIFMEELKAKGVPIILAASKIEGYAGVTFDNKEGIIDGLNYLIEELGVTKLCMLKSWDHNSDVAERYETFKEVLAAHNLELHPKNVVTTGLFSNCREDIERLLDMNPDVEAVFCVNDAVAMGLYSVMKDRGLTPGKDIKVLGFDNSISGGMITPSLSTVDASAEKLGSRVIGMAKRFFEGWEIGEMTIPTRFIHRDSYGSILDKDDIDYRILNKDYLDEYFKRIFFKFENISSNDSLETLIMFKTVMSIIIDYIDDREYNQERVIFLKSKLDEFFKTGALDYTDVDVLLAYLDRILEAVLARFDNDERKFHAYETFVSILEKIASTLHGSDMDYKNRVKKSFELVRKVVDENMSFGNDPEKGYENILNNLKSMGVKDAYIYIYPKCISHKENEELSAPKNVLLKCAMQNGEKIEIPEEENIISIDNLYNNQFIKDETFKMVLFPLYWHENIYGSMLIQLTEVSFRAGDFLANQAGLAVWMIDILTQNMEYKRLLNIE